MQIADNLHEMSVYFLRTKKIKILSSKILPGMLSIKTYIASFLLISIIFPPRIFMSYAMVNESFGLTWTISLITL